MTAFALLFTLAAIGISETAYLVRVRLGSGKLICPVGGGCEKVMSSSYKNIFLIPNDILGLLAYIFMALFSALIVIGVAPAPLWYLILVGLVSVSSLVSVFFTYVQWRIIKIWCFWCLMSAVTIWLMGVILIINSVV